MGDKFLGGDDRDWEQLFSWILLIVGVIVFAFIVEYWEEFLNALR